MLTVIFGDCENVIYNTSLYFKNSYEPELPYSVDEIYGIHVSGKYAGLRQVYHEFYHIYEMEESIVVYDDRYKEGVFAFTDRCFRELGKAFEPEGRHSFYNDIGNVFDSFWCLLSGGDVIGTVALRRLDEETAELKALYLAEEYRGRGLGYRLLDTAVTAARQAGYGRVVLDSMSGYASALRLYGNYGFRITERFNDNPHADVFMELRF